MSSRSSVSGGESVRGRIRPRAETSRRCPRRPATRRTASSNSSGVASGACRRSSASPAMTSSRSVSDPASWHQASTGWITGSPNVWMTRTSPGRIRWPCTPIARGNPSGANAATCTCPRSRRGSGSPCSSAAVPWLKTSVRRIRAAYARQLDTRERGSTSFSRTPWNGRARSGPRRRPSPIPAAAASRTWNGPAARSSGSRRLGGIHPPCSRTRPASPPQRALCTIPAAPPSSRGPVARHPIPPVR